jgi:hypothetical protein
MNLLDRHTFFGIALLVALVMSYFFSISGLGDTKQYLSNVIVLSENESDLLLINSHKSLFYVFLFTISKWIGANPAYGIFFVGILSFISMLLLGLREVRPNRSFLIFFTGLVIVTSPYFLYFFLSNIRSGFSLVLCLLGLVVLRRFYLRIFFVAAAFAAHKISFIIVGIYLFFHIFKRFFGNCSFGIWFLALGILNGFAVSLILFDIGLVSFDKEAWGSGFLYTVGYHVAFIAVCKLFWEDNFLSVAALSALLFSAWCYLADIHAVRMLSLSGVLCLFLVLRHNGKNTDAKLLVMALLFALSIFHYYLILGS